VVPGPVHDKIYYMPREGQNLATADVEIPRLQTLVSGTGTEAHPLTGLAFKGISFEYGGWTAPNGPNGFSEVQANMTLTGADAYADQGSCTRFSATDPGTCPYGAWTMTPGNVVFDHTSGLTITGSTFEHLGAAGLQLGQDVDGSTIQGNQFTDISGNGLEIGNGTDADPTDLALLPAGNTIADNWVHNIAVEYNGGVGIFQGYTRNDVIEHNQINDVPYSGISSNWGWGYNPTASTGNKILDNLVFDAMQPHGDGGGIYVLGIEGDSLADGLLISGNVVRNGNGNGNSIYTDGGSEYITMTGNAMFDSRHPVHGRMRRGDGTPYGGFSFTGNYVENTTPDWIPAATRPTRTSATTPRSPGRHRRARVRDRERRAGAAVRVPRGAVRTAPANLALGKPVQAQYIDGSTARCSPETRSRTPPTATRAPPSRPPASTAGSSWSTCSSRPRSGSVTVTMPQRAYATAFHVDASTDGSNWTTVGTVPTAVGEPSRWSSPRR
jgi:hypothetical protein